MRKLMITFIFMLSLLNGCFTIPFITDGRSYKLDTKYGPLETVEEATDKLFAEGMTTTIGAHSYVPDLKQWKIDYPDGSIDQDAVLLHEQVHAKRQLNFPGGIGAWLALYVSSPSFRWQEEKLGYEAEIRRQMAGGQSVNAPALASVLSHDYKALGGQMVNFNDALIWVNNLIFQIQSGH